MVQIGNSNENIDDPGAREKEWAILPPPPLPKRKSLTGFEIAAMMPKTRQEILEIAENARRNGVWLI